MPEISASQKPVILTNQLTDAEARMLVALSQELRNLRALRRLLGISCMRTLDRLVYRSRRVRPATIAKVRAALHREAARRSVIFFPGLHQ